MGFLFLMLGIMGVTVAIIAITLIYGLQKKRAFRLAITIGVALSLLTGAIACICSNTFHASAARMVEEYETLTLYQTVVENTENEYVRYDFYERVCDYNERYENHVRQSEDKWFGFVYPANWNANIGTVNFYLHGDSFYGEGY